MRKNITVFCGSADDCPAAYLDAAEELGRLIARQGRTLVYGSGMVGLMGRVAKGAIEEGGFVVGINVECYRDFPPYPGTGELLMAKTISERKTLLMERGDAYIALPGGVGTLDELMEVWAVAQAGLLDRPIGLLNVNHYYDGLLTQLERAYQDKLLKEKDYRMLLAAEEPAELLRMLDDYDYE
ncbi:MAG: TIGR00730 family Rossman fold protein [Clostridia bacterium]|nr:TIGR00730 family Rossman fold protein [Clostridia bacterium]